MTFSYDLDTAIGKVRLNLRDTVSGFGPFPSGVNFSDEELEALLSQESGGVMRAVAACCEALATAWTNVATIRGGQRSDDFNHISEMYQKRATALREQYGGGTGGVAFAVGLERVDGYSEAADDTVNDYT